MKKILIIVLIFLLTLCALIPSFLGNNLCKLNFSNAYNNTSYKTVNFYDNDDLLYSVNVPYGVSLNEFENYNLVENSALTISDIPVTFTRQLGFYSFTNYTIDVNGYHFSTSSQWSGLNYAFSFDEIKSDVYFTIRVKSDDVNSNNLGVFSRYFNADGQLVNLNYGITLNNKLTSEYKEFTYIFPYVEDYSFCCFNIWNSGSIGDLKSYSIDYVSLYNSDYSYYSLAYINKLFNRSNNYTLNNNVYWYSSLDFDSFDFNSPITEDINLYSSIENFKTVNFYSNDRLNILYSIKLEYGSNLNSIYSTVKNIYFNNQTQYKLIDDFNLVFTDDYYSYNNYFNENYIILDDKNLYCVAILNNYDIVSPSLYSSFLDFSMGDNLLNQINIDSIKFYVTEFYPLDDTPLYTLKFRQQNPNIILNTNIYSAFTDYYNNTYYYKIYGYIEDNLYLYDIYLYRVNMTDFEHFCFYPCPPDLFIIDNYYMNNFFSYVFYDTQYYFKYDIDFNMNYYYADYFALTSGFTNGSKVNDFIYYDTSNRLYYMGSYSSVNSIKGLVTGLTLNSYVNSFSFNVKSRTQFVGLPVTDDFYYQLFEEIGGLEFYNPKVYYYQSDLQSNGNNIIPTDTSGLYKQKQNWWDFGTDIYNMFIYIIFEAPIISNITELIYLLIALIINTILTIVGLFSSVNNTIFIAMILGFLLFKFITKKFLGGSS